MNPLREEMFPYRSVSVAGVVFQACAIDHSAISPLELATYGHNFHAVEPFVISLRNVTALV